MHSTVPEHAEQMGQTNSPSESGRLPPWAMSPEVWLMFQPKAAYQWLADTPEGRNNWTAARRPVYFAFLLGCFVSLVASQRLTLRHVAGGAINGGLLPLAQIVALRIVCWRERKVSFSRLVDLFFAGYGPWTLWILAFSVVWAFLPPERAFAFGWSGSIVVTAGLVTIWSLYINYRFFEGVLRRSKAGAVWDTMRIWAMCWCVCILIFGWGALWSEYLRIPGR